MTNDETPAPVTGSPFDFIPDNVNGRELIERALGKRQCRAVSKTSGKQCQSPPIIGGFVCRIHGGANPIAIDKARQRLRALVDPAIDALTRTITMAYADPCKECGGPTDAKMMSVVVKASQLVLDRCGYGPKKEVEHSFKKGPEGWEQYLLDGEVEQIQAWVAAAKARALAAGSEVVDAEIVEAADDEG